MKNSFDATVKKVTYNPHDRVAHLRALTPTEQSAVLVALSPYVQQQVLKSLTTDEIVQIIDYLDLQTARVVLRRISDGRRRQKIINRLKTEVKDKVEYFLRFHPKATLSLVHFNYVLLSITETVAGAGEAIDAHYNETGKFPEVLITDNGELVGEVSIAKLVRERNSIKLERLVTGVTTVTYQAEVQDIVKTLTESRRKKIVVLDADGSVLGIIYAEDAVDLFGVLPAESLYSFTGLNSSERPLDSAYLKFHNRYRWLILNLMTAFVAGSVVLSFKDTIDQLAILAVYIPIVTGMGGNAASQTFAVMLRGLTMGTISFTTGVPAIWKEMQAGLLSGIVIGLIVALVSVLFHSSAMLGLSVALSMIVVHVVAGLFGAAVPLVVKRFGMDPAAISMIFISTATDVFGMLALLGFGSLLLL